MKRIGLALPFAILALAGCDGLRSAMSAHTDVAARAGSQELTTEKLADLLGNSTVPLAPEVAENEQVARAVADVWVNYQLMAQAAAKNDSLKDVKKMDVALWQEINGAKTGKFIQEVSKSWISSDTAITEAEYNQGDLLSAAHILFMFPPAAGPAQMDSVKKVAERIHKTVTLANFSTMVKQHSKDPGSVDKNGLYAAFPRGAMAKEFEEGVLALKPGEMSGLVQTGYGYHIIRRPLFDEVRSEHGRAKATKSAQKAESSYFAGVMESHDINVNKNAPKLVKEIAEKLAQHEKDRSVLATYKGGRYTAADFARVVRASPQRAQTIQQVMQIPDTAVPTVVKQLVLSNYVLPRLADSAKLGPDSTEMNAIRNGLTGFLANSWTQLGVDPSSLGDSAKKEADRLREAASRVDMFMAGLMSATKPYIPVPDPLEVLLRSTFSYSISTDGLRRAIEQAGKVRAKADSARAQQAQQSPPSQVPMNDRSGAPPPETGKTPPPSGRSGGH